ncbi:MAG: hypothetical protein M3Y27_06115, partial [Acidobacteriota bacterium]|nr:hypothetical protein [Acidobacteriota bacterium]
MAQFDAQAAVGLNAHDGSCVRSALGDGDLLGQVVAAGFDPLATLEAIAAERCTAVYGVPTMFIAMLDHAAFADFDL